MIGDAADIARRLTSVLPTGWFSDNSPVAGGVLSAFSNAWTSIYDLISSVTVMTRIGSCSGSFLDFASADYFGSKLPRKPGEKDTSFLSRIKQELFRPRGTRAALQQAIQDITGRPAYIIEPARPSDTGGYTVGGVSYSQAGAWGSLDLSHRFFVTAHRPQGIGIAEIAGYGTGGPLEYGSISMVASAVSDGDIYAAAAAVLPLGFTAWLRIDNA